MRYPHKTPNIEAKQYWSKNMRNIAYLGKIRKWSIFRTNLLKIERELLIFYHWMNTRFLLFQMMIILYGLSTYNYLKCSSESGEIPIFYNIPKCSIFRSVFLKMDQRPQTNFDFQKLIISCFQTVDIRNVIKLPTFFVIGFERISYFCQIAETCHIHTPIYRNVNAWRQK